MPQNNDTTTTPPAAIDEKKFGRRLYNGTLANAGNVLLDLLKTGRNALGEGIMKNTVEGHEKAKALREQGGFWKKVGAAKEEVKGLFMSTLSLVHPGRWLKTGWSLTDNGWRSLITNPLVRIQEGFSADMLGYERAKVQSMQRRKFPFEE